MDKTDDPSMDKTWKFFWLNFYILQTNSKQDSTWTRMNNTKTKTLKQYAFPEEKALSMIILEKYLLLKNMFGVKTLSLTQSWQRRRAHSCLIGNLHHRFNPRGSTAAKGGRGHSQNWWEPLMAEKYMIKKPLACSRMSRMAWTNFDSLGIVQALCKILQNL